MTTTKKDCTVCCNAVAATRMVACGRCAYEVCTACQKQYGKASCMQCRELFDRPFVRSVLGNDFCRNVLLPELREMEIATQKDALQQIQAMVDWEIAKDRILSRRRFGDKTPLPEKPEFRARADGNRPVSCPGADCRGFVAFKFGEASRCGTCKKRVCVRCREFADSDDHACVASTLESIRAIAEETKPCPTCRSPIQKSVGCDHMKCTNCGANFLWRSLRLIKTSTNHHYNHMTPISAASSSCGGSAASSAVAETDIPIDAYRGPPETTKLVYDDLACIRFIKSHEFDEEKIVKRANDAIIRAGVQFLGKKIDEQKWRNRIVSAYEQREAHLSCANIIDIVVDEVRLAQSDLHRKNGSKEDVLARVRSAMEMAETSLAEIQDAHGGIPGVRLRRPDEDPALPPIIFSRKSRS
jgi:hypothetical protein